MNNLQGNRGRIKKSLIATGLVTAIAVICCTDALSVCGNIMSMCKEEVTKSRRWSKEEMGKYSLSERLAFSQIFDEPLMLRNYLYSKGELNDYLYYPGVSWSPEAIKIPVRLTRNTTDGQYHWSNDHRFVESHWERLMGRIKPTHLITFSTKDDGSYVSAFTVNPINR